MKRRSVARPCLKTDVSANTHWNQRRRAVKRLVLEEIAWLGEGVANDPAIRAAAERLNIGVDAVRSIVDEVVGELEARSKRLPRIGEVQ